jgi:hypothetical protein
MLAGLLPELGQASLVVSLVADLPAMSALEHNFVILTPQANCNQRSSTRKRAHVTSYTYDRLIRLVSILQLLPTLQEADTTGYPEVGRDQTVGQMRSRLRCLSLVMPWRRVYQAMANFPLALELMLVVAPDKLAPRAPGRVYYILDPDRIGRACANPTRAPWRQGMA